MKAHLRLIAGFGWLLAVTGCVHISPQAMPAEWPALRATTPAELSGEFAGTSAELSRTAAIFFTADELYANPKDKVTALHLAANEQALAVRIGCSDGRTLERTVPIVWEQGAAVLTRRFSGSEGGNAATYSDSWRITTNSANELVIEHIRFATGRLLVVPAVSYYREWWRLRRVR